MEYKIYKIDDYEWWVGKSLEECVDAYIKEYFDGDESEKKELLEYNEPREITEKELDTLIFYDDIYNQDESKKRTFREELKRLVNNETDRIPNFPCMFASSEY